MNFKTLLMNNISYLALHAAGIPYTYEHVSDLKNSFGQPLHRKISEVETILIPTLDGNMEEVLDTALRNIKEEGII